MPNKEILEQGLIPSCKIWNEFMNLLKNKDLYWSQKYIFRNPNFQGTNPIYISTQNYIPEKLYNAFHNLDQWHHSDMWVFRIKDICELEDSDNLNKYFLREVAQAVLNNDQNEIDRLAQKMPRNNQDNNSILRAPTYEGIVNILREKNQEFAEFIGQHLITKVELLNKSNKYYSGGNNIKNANMSAGNNIENDDSFSGKRAINSTDPKSVYILFSFVMDDYFQSEFIDRLGLTCNIL
jgi:hypothetical protein